VFIADVSENLKSLQLEFAGRSETFDLKGVKFKEFKPADLQIPDPERYLSFLEISFPDGTAWLLGESVAKFNPNPVM